MNNVFFNVRANTLLSDTAEFSMFNDGLTAASNAIILKGGTMGLKITSDGILKWTGSE